jgi:hypothetical protein
LIDLISNMNRGRVSTNINFKATEISKDRINDLLKITPLYDFGPDGGLIEKETGRAITDAKYYKLTSQLDNNPKPIYLKGKSELCNFFKLSDVSIYKKINKSLPILKNGINYNITKVF